MYKGRQASINGINRTSGVNPEKSGEAKKTFARGFISSFPSSCGGQKLGNEGYSIRKAV